MRSSRDNKTEIEIDAFQIKALLMTNLQKWQVLASKFVWDHRWCRVRQDQVLLPNGNYVDDYFVVARPDVALILAVTPQAEVVMVRQYRHGVGEILLELPAGTFDPNTESPETAALRELEEETGYTCTKLIKLATLHDNPVKDTNRIHLFLAPEAVRLGAQRLDVTEEIEVVIVPQTKILEKIASGEICVSGTIAALFLGLNLRSQT